MAQRSLLHEKWSFAGSGKIKIGEYPYTYVRTTVMRTLLIDSNSYERLLKMSVPEILRFLEETQYRKEIDDLSLRYAGTELIEQALNANLVKAFDKLRKISNDSLLNVIDAYLLRYDIQNLKTILRGRFTKASDDSISRLIVPAGILSEKSYANLLKAQNFDDLFKNSEVSGILPYTYMRSALDAFRNKQDIAKLESSLDKYYFMMLLDFVSRLSGQGSSFRDFIMAEVEVLNILTILRLKRENVSNADIKSFLISTKDARHDRKLSTLLLAQDTSAVLKRLMKLGYADILHDAAEDYKKTSSLTHIEMSLKRHLLRRTLRFTHQNPLSIDTILSFMFAKAMEIRNLLIIIKCRQFGFDESFTRSQLVIA